MNNIIFHEDNYDMKCDTNDKTVVKYVKIMSKKSNLNNVLTYYKIYAKFDQFGTTSFILTDEFDNEINEYAPSRDVLFIILSEIKQIEDKRGKL